MAEVALALQIFTTLAMVGLIWFVQVVHYPLFAKVGDNGFANYERSHQKRTTLIVAPLMLVEALTAFALVPFRPPGIGDVSVLMGIVLLATIWLSTAFIQVPAHARLAKSFNFLTHRTLVTSNWLRTAAWSARGMLVVWMTVEVVQTASSN